MTTDEGATSRFGPISTEAAGIVRDAEAAGIVLRLIGSLGVRLHCVDARQVQDRFDRSAKDIDLVCRRSDRKQLRQFMVDRGYEVDRGVLIAMEGERYLFRHPDLGVELDVFVDPLDFCHVVQIGSRFVEHPLSIPIEHLVLHKLQIVEMTRGDYVDLFTLLLTHEVPDSQTGAEDPELIATGRIADVLATDWGFYRTATQNLDRLVDALRKPGSELPTLAPQDAQVVEARIEALRAAIEDRPKSLSWRLRSKVGERMQWWQDVDVPREAY